MPLVTSKEMFEKAYNGGYAIGAFNVNNMEIIQGITEAAAELKAPLILQVSKGARAYANRTYLKKLVEAAVIETGLPIVLHLDHGDSFELCKSCIEDGFTSVMIDASSKPFAENIALTRQVVEYAHDHGVVVEAELGTLAGIEDEVNVSAEDSSYTRPEEVEEFVSKTGCDSLAIAIGTSHGAYKFKPGTKPQLRFDVLEEVSRRLPGFPIAAAGPPPAAGPAAARPGSSVPGRQNPPCTVPGSGPQSPPAAPRRREPYRPRFPRPEPVPPAAQTAAANPISAYLLLSVVGHDPYAHASRRTHAGYFPASCPSPHRISCHSA